jgi:hypothetical protein
VRRELRERRERDLERRAEAEELRTEVEEPLFLPTPAFIASAEEDQGVRNAFCCSFLLVYRSLSFVISLLRLLSLGTGLGGG